MTPNWLDLLSEWNWAPSVIAGLLVLAGIYLVLSGWIRWKGNRIPRGSSTELAWFFGGLLLIFFALVSPLDEWGDHYLFSAHMAQHMILMLAAPIFLILGLPDRLTHRAGAVPALRQLGRFLTSPLVAFILFNFTYVIWHIPVFYEATLENEGLHIFEHLTFMAAGVINWWPIFSRSVDFPPASSGVQILFLFLEGIPSTVLTAIIVFASDILYPTYAAAPRVFGISAVDDQQIAGLGMGSISMFFYLAIFTYVFFRWQRSEEKQQSADISLS